MKRNQQPYIEPNFPDQYYYPSYYYPNHYAQNSLQQPYQNSQQPLYFEMPDQYEQPNSVNLQNTVAPFFQYFQDDQGEVDIDKVIATTNQFMKTASQIAPMVKTLNDFVKGMRP